MLAATPAAGVYSAHPSEPRNSLEKLGVLCGIAYIFFVYSRFLELLVEKAGSSLYIMPVIMFVCLAVTALRGRLSAFLTEKPLQSMLLFYIWMVLSFPFSIWRGGSLPVTMYMFRMALICVAVVGVLDTTEDCRKAMVAMAIAMFFVLFLGFTRMPSGEMDDDMRFRFDYGSLANPNEFANHVMIGLPICAVLLIKKSKIFVNRILYAGLFFGSFALLMKTGSRGGITLAVVLGVVVFFAASFIDKFKLIVVGAVLAFVIVAATPRGALARYATLFSDTGTIEAVQSKASRLELLRASLRITARHPLLGVGLGNFVVEYNEDLSSVGSHGHWEATHNAYTQISSEMGVPALLFYVGVIFFCFRNLLRVRKASRGVPALATVRKLSSSLLLALLAYAVSGLFTSNGHEFYFPLLTGLSVVLCRAAQKDIAALRNARSATPAPEVLPAVRKPLSSTPLAGRRLQFQ